MKNIRFENTPVILCVGTTKVIGDSLGPLVGDILIGKYNLSAYVYGKSSSQVNGITYNGYVNHINKNHAKSFVIAVDACLGNKDDIGKIKYTTQGLSAGAALNKNFAKMGDIAILGVVGEKCQDNMSSLINANKVLVENLAIKIAEKIFSLLGGNLRLNYN